MIDIPIVFAFTAGLAALVSPCGAVMLPAYISYYLGLEDEKELGNDFFKRFKNALLIGVVASLGLILLFGIFGLLWSVVGQFVKDVLPNLGLLLGIILAGMGFYVAISGRGLILPVITLNKYELKKSYGSVFIFGVAYGVATVSCTFPIFLAIMAHALTVVGTGAVLIQFLAYGSGLGFGLIVITLLAALFKKAAAQLVRSALPYMERFYGLVLFFSGTYIAWYWYKNWFLFS